MTKQIDSSLIFEPNYDSLYNIDRVDRVADWDQATYKLALEGALEVRGYSRWIIGMLVTEIQQKWPQVTYALLAQDLTESRHDVSPSTLRAYSDTYRAFTNSSPGYVPSGYLPWSIMTMVAREKVEGVTPAEMANQLEDEGVATVKGAYKKIKEAQTGIVLPVKPVFSVSVDKDPSKDKCFNVFVKADREGLMRVNWEGFRQQILDIMGQAPWQ